MRDAGTIAEIRSALAGGAVADALVRERWERAQALEPAIRAFAHLPETSPAAGAGPLAGVTVGVKDLIDTADMPTAYGSPLHAGGRPAADAAVVERLRALGATVLGKTVTTEFAWRHPGPTRNPWDLERTPGGSSSGSAAAVAAGVVTLALGTQTLGSIIRPAAFCGVVGFKPSFGSLPREGVHPLSGSLDHVGLFARSLDDVDCAFALLTDADPAAPVAETPPRVAALRPPADLISAEQMAAFESACRDLDAAGVIVETIDWPDLLDRSAPIGATIVAYEAARILGDRRRTGSDLLSRHIIELVDAGLAVSEADYVDALAAQRTLRETFAARMEPFDALLAAPATGEAPEGLDHTGDPRFCTPWTVIGAPAVSIPIALGRSGAPLGLQIVGRNGSDRALLAAAKAIGVAVPTIGAPPPPA